MTTRTYPYPNSTDTIQQLSVLLNADPNSPHAQAYLRECLCSIVTSPYLKTGAPSNGIHPAHLLQAVYWNPLWGSHDKWDFFIQLGEKLTHAFDTICELVQTISPHPHLEAFLIALACNRARIIDQHVSPVFWTYLLQQMEHKTWDYPLSPSSFTSAQQRELIRHPTPGTTTFGNRVWHLWEKWFMSCETPNDTAILWKRYATFTADIQLAGRWLMTLDPSHAAVLFPLIATGPATLHGLFLLRADTPSDYVRKGLRYLGSRKHLPEHGGLPWKAAFTQTDVEALAGTRGLQAWANLYTAATLGLVSENQLPRAHSFSPRLLAATLHQSPAAHAALVEFQRAHAEWAAHTLGVRNLSQYWHEIQSHTLGDPPGDPRKLLTTCQALALWEAQDPDARAGLATGYMTELIHWIRHNPDDKTEPLGVLQTRRLELFRQHVPFLIFPPPVASDPDDEDIST